MCPITKIKAEGEPADGSRRGGGNDGRSRTGFISGGFHRQTLAPTHPGVSGLPSHLIWLGHMVNSSPNSPVFKSLKNERGCNH